MHPTQVGETAREEKQRHMLQLAVREVAVFTIAFYQRRPGLREVIFVLFEIQGRGQLEQVPAETRIVEIDQSDHLAIHQQIL